MPNLLLKMMASYTMTAEEVTLRVRERIGSSAPLIVSYQSQGRESARMQEQLELGCRLFNITIDSRHMAERFHQMLLIHLNTLKFFSDSRLRLKRHFLYRFSSYS